MRAGVQQNGGRLFEGIEDGSYVYFVHSYYLKAAKDDVKNGRVHQAESVEDMFQQILGYVPGQV